MTATRLPGCACINCHKLVDGATSVDREQSPTPGDMTVCVYCGHLMAFDDNLMLRELTDAEIVECAGDPRILLAQKICGKFRENLS